MFSYGQTRTQRVPTLSGTQQRTSDALAAQIMAGLGQGSPATPFQTWVPETLLEGQVRSNVMSEENMAMRQNALNQILSGQPAFTYNEGQINEAFRPIKKEMFTNLNEQIIPNIAAGAVGPGGAGRYSSGYLNQVRQASQDTANRVGAMYGGFTMEKQGTADQEIAAARTRQAQFGPMAAASEYQLQSSVAAQDRAVREQEVMAKMQEWFSGAPVNGVRNPWANPWIQLAMNYLGQPQYAVGQTGYQFSI